MSNSNLKENPKKRLPKYRRVSLKDAPKMILQERDLEIIKAVWDYRFLTTDHIRAMIPGTRRKIYERLRKLYHRRYLDRLFFTPALYTGGSQKAIYALDKRGTDVLVEEAGVPREAVRWSATSKEFKERYLRHALMISNFRVTLACALAENPEVELFYWKQGNVLKEIVYAKEDGKRIRYPVVPDAFFGIRDYGRPAGQQDSYFFLECDRSTMTNERYLKKMRGYWHYGRQKKHEEMYDISSFRVLTLTMTEQRENNLVRVTRKADDRQVGSPMFWFTNEKKYELENPGSILAPIWQTPKSKKRDQRILE